MMGCTALSGQRQSYLRADARALAVHARHQGAGAVASGPTKASKACRVWAGFGAVSRQVGGASHAGPAFTCSLQGALQAAH
jgi:hypothetical protein